MNKFARKSMFVLLAGGLLAGSLAGCGEKKKEAAALDGTQVVATVDGNDITMGMLSLVTRQQQAQMESLYQMYMGSSDIWDTASSDDSGETVGEQTVKDVLASLEQMVVVSHHAEDYQVEVTDEEEDAILKAAAQFMADNSEETLADLAVTEEQVAEVLRLQTYGQKVYDAVRAEAEVEISDEEAVQSSFHYVRVSSTTEGLTDEDKAALLEKAQAVLDLMLEDPGQDLEAAAKSVDDSLYVVAGSFPKDENQENYTSFPDVLIEGLRGLEDGQYAPEVIDASTDANVIYYVARLDLAEDPESTASRRESLENTARTDYYNAKAEEWTEAAADSITENAEVLKTLTLTNDHKYSVVSKTASTEATDTPEEADSEETAEEETEETADKAEEASEE